MRFGARWKSLNAGVIREDLTAWRDAFLRDLLQPAPDRETLMPPPAMAR
jgi:hypothetical protein